MRILHLLYESEGDLFGIGGVGVRAYEIYGRLKDRHEVTLLCKRYPGARDGVIRGIRHRFVGTESRSLTVTLLSYAWGCNRFVRRHGQEYDVIVEEFSPAVPTFLRSAPPGPYVLQVQGHTGALYFRKYNPAYALVLWILERYRPGLYRRFIFLTRETVNRVGPPSSLEFEVIPNGVPDDLLSLTSEDDDYMLYLGRIDVYGKGLDLLLSAFGEFCASSDTMRLVVAGDGRDMQAFRRKVEELPAGVRSRIEMRGWVEGRAKRETLSRASFVVLPSRHEVQPISVLEAMASGKAVVVSDIPEFRFIADQDAGILFRSGDAASLSKAMKAMATHPGRRDMGGRARTVVRGFTWDRIVQQYEMFLQKVYNTHQSRGRPA
jgi:glycosyltransferase involved in cell wall biosynthesis